MSPTSQKMKEEGLLTGRRKSRVISCHVYKV